MALLGRNNAPNAPNAAPGPQDPRPRAPGPGGDALLFSHPAPLSLSGCWSLGGHGTGRGWVGAYVRVYVCAYVCVLVCVCVCGYVCVGGIKEAGWERPPLTSPSSQSYCLTGP